MGRQFRTLLMKCWSVMRQNQRNVHSGIPSLKIGVIGVPFGKGQILDEGPKRSPDVLRQGRLLQELLQLGHNAKDYGDISYNVNTEDIEKVLKFNKSRNKKLNNLADVAACNHQLSNKVVEILATDSKVLVLGGDHSVAVGSVDGHIRSHGDIALLYVDAHADSNTADSSPSGNMHGMTMALLLKELRDQWPNLPGMEWQKPALSVKNIAYIGLRTVDEFERFVLDKFSTAVFGMAELEKYGVSKVTEMALDKVDPKGTRSLHVSFDIDSLDVSEVPSIGFPEKGGLSLTEGAEIMEIVHRTGRMNVMDLVEINPNIGNAQDVAKTAAAAIHVIKAAYGSRRLKIV